MLDRSNAIASNEHSRTFSYVRPAVTVTDSAKAAHLEGAVEKSSSCSDGDSTPSRSRSAVEKAFRRNAAAVGVSSTTCAHAHDHSVIHCLQHTLQ